MEVVMIVHDIREVRFTEPVILSGKTRGKLRIVVVDDHKIMRYSLCHLLSTVLGLEVVGVGDNGLTGVERVRELRPALVVMDVRMPVMDGIEATRLIKAEFPDTIVVGLSSNCSKEVRGQMLAAGAVDLFDKADTGRRLLVCVKQMLDEAVMQKQVI